MTEESSFEGYVKEKMQNVLKSHNHNHELYRETEIEKSIIDSEKGIAAFVLSEQIDTDRASNEGVGWKGDQFRYSLWYIKEGEEPKQFFRDQDYLRRSKSELIGSIGRDAGISLEGLLENGVLAGITPKNSELSFGDLSQTKVEIDFDGQVREPEDFFESAKNIVKRVGKKLGYDYLKDSVKLEGKDAAAMVWAAENGRTYGEDTLYLVWKDKQGELQYKEFVNSRFSKGVLNIENFERKEGEIFLHTNEIKLAFDESKLA